MVTLVLIYCEISGASNHPDFCLKALGSRNYDPFLSECLEMPDNYWMCLKAVQSEESIKHSNNSKM